MMNSCLFSLLALGVSLIVAASGQDPIRATCTIQSLNQMNKTVAGVIRLSQPANGNTTVSGYLTGFTWGGKHGFHVHQYGDLSNSCIAAGVHYNPFNKTHGGQNSTVRHVGDLGNIYVSNSTLDSNFTIVDSQISLQGSYSIVNLSIVVHSGEDDLGMGISPDSNTTGNSGYRIGCCVITLDPNSTTPAPTAPTVTTPAGEAAFIRPLMTVFVLCFLTVQVAQKFIDGKVGY